VTGEANSPMKEAWLPDPTGRHELRWWTGTFWSEHVSDAGETSIDQPGTPPPPPPHAPKKKGEKPWRAQAWWAIGLGLAAWVVPIFARAAIQTANPNACVRYFFLESLALAVPGAILAGNVYGRTVRPRTKLAWAAMIIGAIGVLSPIGQLGARQNDPCFAESASAAIVLNVDTAARKALAPRH